MLLHVLVWSLSMKEKLSLCIQISQHIVVTVLEILMFDLPQSWGAYFPCLINFPHLTQQESYPFARCKRHLVLITSRDTWSGMDFSVVTTEIFKRLSLSKMQELYKKNWRPFIFTVRTSRNNISHSSEKKIWMEEGDLNEVLIVFEK